MPKTRKEAKNVGLSAKEPKKSAKPERMLFGSSTVRSNYRLTLNENIREKLNVKVGDIVLFGEDENGNLFIKIIKK